MHTTMDTPSGRTAPHWYHASMVRHLIYLFAGAAFFAATAFAQLPDNSFLTGTYNVRYLGGAIGSTTDTAMSFQGQITFDGKGGFTVTGGSGVSGGAALKTLTTGTTYTVLSSGMVALTNPFADPKSTQGGAMLYGGVGANKTIVASSTESLYLDLFIAIPAATSTSAAALNGNYRLASMEFLNGDFTATRSTFFQATADAKGGLGNLTIAGASQSLANKATTQTSNGATYTVTANGTGQLTIPAPGGTTAGQTLLSGQKTLFVSQDGSFFIAGNPTGYDFVVGVKSAPAGTQMNGLYWLAYMENAQASDGSSELFGISGSANELASAGNVEIAHERTNSEFDFPYDLLYNDVFKFDNTGTAVSTYAIGGNGDIVVFADTTGAYFFGVYVKAPAMSAPAGTTAFLNPQGVVNAASYAPVTAQVSPGTMMTLFGSSLGPANIVQASSLPFPTTLGGVTVTVNGTAAPLYYVSATQIAMIVPSSAPSDTSPLSIQVTYNGAQSNTVVEYSGLSSPGAYTVGQDGISSAIIHHVDGSNVTAASPAKVGETVIMAMNGMGPVSPASPAGSAGPSSPLSQLSQPLQVLIDGVPATVQFAGLAPGFAGLYQLNITIPAGVSKGAVSIEIDTSQGSGSSLDLDVANVISTIFIQ
jgi:uncharacterized protein (TIGR03437 family)